MWWSLQAEHRFQQSVLIPSFQKLERGGVKAPVVSESVLQPIKSVLEKYQYEICVMIYKHDFYSFEFTHIGFVKENKNEMIQFCSAASTSVACTRP